KFCVAVGTYIGSRASVMMWNGLRWRVSVDAHVSQSTTFTDVSCTSSTFCEAVGWVGTGPFAETWNGSRWSISHPVIERNTGLQGVSCWSDAGCVAVGTLGFHEALVETWNGHGWSLGHVPNPKGATASFDDMACIGPNACGDA